MCRPVIKELIKKIIEVYFKSSVTTSERRFCFHVINFLKVIGETCEKCQWPAYLLKMSLFHSCFSNILLVKTNYLVST